MEHIWAAWDEDGVSYGGTVGEWDTPPVKVRISLAADREAVLRELSAIWDWVSRESQWPPCRGCGATHHESDREIGSYTALMAGDPDTPPFGGGGPDA